MRNFYLPKAYVEPQLLLPSLTGKIAHALQDLIDDRTIEVDEEDRVVLGNKLFVDCSLGDNRKSNRISPFSLHNNPT